MHTDLLISRHLSSGQPTLHPLSTPRREGSLLWKIMKGVGYMESFLLALLQLIGHSMTTVTQSSQFWTPSPSLFPVSRVILNSFLDLSRVNNISHFERQLQGCKTCFFFLSYLVREGPKVQVSLS